MIRIKIIIMNFECLILNHLALNEGVGGSEGYPNICNHQKNTQNYKLQVGRLYHSFY